MTHYLNLIITHLQIGGLFEVALARVFNSITGYVISGGKLLFILDWQVTPTYRCGYTKYAPP